MLETKIDLSKVCAKKVRVERQSYVSDPELKCRNCDGYSFGCYDYFPISKTQIPIRRGRNYMLVK